MILNGEILVLVSTAASIGFLHTITGPDHYLPFIVLSRSRDWSIFKTMSITFLCGLGHIFSSVILGSIGLAMGIAVFKLETFEKLRAGYSGWLLIIFGLAYFIWGMYKALRLKAHRHHHCHDGDCAHSHSHKHTFEHSHAHHFKLGGELTPWVLFIIFAFGPCEPLIPLVMYPAAKQDMMLMWVVVLAFGIATIATMLTVVLVSYYSLPKFSSPRLEKYSHALAGAAILVCGIVIKLFGL